MQVDIGTISPGAATQIAAAIGGISFDGRKPALAIFEVLRCLQILIRLQTEANAIMRTIAAGSARVIA